VTGSLDDWTSHSIHAECGSAYRAYLRNVRERHIEYFAKRPDRRSEKHPFAARDLEAAFPDEWRHLANALPRGAWHRHCLSGGSSQVLAIALLAAATSADPSLRWLRRPYDNRAVATFFEVVLTSDLLNERPRQTAIDWLVLTDQAVLVAEAKFTELGLGGCSCVQRGAGVCSPRVLERPYWEVAEREMGLTRDTNSCQLGLAYQAVRNVAAARAIAGSRKSTFLLLYDARNPYFAGAGSWPGWVTMLSSLMSGSTTTFASLAWQEIVEAARVGESVRGWAREKHGL
jgi:hypothetical protein